MILDDGLTNIIRSPISGTTRSQTSVSRLWYDSSSLPVLIMADAKDDISSALQQLYLLDGQAIRDLE
jgi:hypothetical protein